MADILQRRLPYDPMAPRPLPGIQPLALEDWLIADEAFAGQMAERARLLAERREAVLALAEGARGAALELLDLVLSLAYPGAGEMALRPDGIAVPIDRADPLATLGHLVQEDLCLLQTPEGAAEHILTGAVLCFPASWKLAEKIGRPLLAIHDPVASYDAGIAARVQRLFDGVQPGRPLWRFNALWYEEAALHQPRSRHQRRPQRRAGEAPFLRSERQCILRLPQSGAVVFSIHTYVLARADVASGPG
ncbi:MAG: DUF3445 domain-containing protein [Sedimentitalea sp.]|nr:DUF3445 domain-containing protein [Sedimentitalea sp.]